MLIRLLKHLYKIITKQERVLISRYFPIGWLDKIKEIEPRKNEFVYKTIISCSGCGFSGSSAVTDFLAEFDNCSAFGGVTDDEARGRSEAYEIDFFRDGVGIYALEKMLTSPIRRTHNAAIHDFVNTVWNNYMSKCPIYDEFYLSESKKFIKNLIDFEIPLPNGDKEYIPKCMNDKEFRAYASKYIDNVFSNISSKDFLILDQFLSLDYIPYLELDDYFKSYKIIFVWSDPRDMYIRSMNHKVSWVPKDAKAFVKYFHRRTEAYFDISNKHLLKISFDDLCYDYENTSKKIMKFLGLSEKQHIKKLMYFNPEESRKNTRLWETYPDKQTIQYIYDNLKEYCIN